MKIIFCIILLGYMIFGAATNDDQVKKAHKSMIGVNVKGRQQGDLQAAHVILDANGVVKIKE